MSHEQQKPLELIQTSFSDVQEHAKKHQEALESFKVHNVLEFEVAPQPKEESPRIRTQRAILGASAMGFLPLEIHDEA